MEEKALTYFSYLVRLWRDGGEQSWHASLEDPHSGRLLHFATAAELFAFLQEEMAAADGGFES